MSDNLLKKVLKQRFSSQGEIDLFVPILQTNLPTPEDLQNFRAKVLRWFCSLNKEQPILIFGDYDVDGLFSSSLARLYLEELGYKVDIFIPSRVSDGYGFNKETITSNNLDNYTQYLILDSGTNESKYMDEELPSPSTLCIDHHTPAIENTYPFLINPHFDFEKKGDFCTGSLVFLMGLTLSTLYPELNQHYGTGITMAAIATLADQCMLIDHNRALVGCAMPYINDPTIKLHPGLEELLKNLFNSRENITETDLVWKLSPCINASGRLNKTSIVLDLFDKDKSISQRLLLTHQLIELNEERKELTDTAFEQAVKQILDENQVDWPILCVNNSSWKAGIVGIIAGHLAQKFNKPAFAMTSHTGETWEGSGRSVANISILSVAKSLKEHLVGFGGHAQAMGIKTAKIDQFKNALSKIILDPSFDVSESAQQESYPAIKITNNLVCKEEIDSLNCLRPFGNGNPAPVFKVEAVVSSIKPAKTGYTTVLTDTSGRIRCYIPPTISENFEKYIGETIIVEGDIDYTPPYTPSMMVRNISPS